MKAHWGSGGIAPHLLDLGTRWRWVGQLHDLAALPPGRSPWYPLDRLGGTQSRCGRGGEKKNSQPPPGIEPPIIQPTAQRYTTELSWLLKYNRTGVKIYLNLLWF
jgi:hypothetical protein